MLRALPPHATEEDAADHDGSMRRCFSRLLESDIPDTSWEVANLPFSIGGLGLRKGSRISVAAYWASWADCLHTVQTQHPVLGVQISAALSQGGIGQHMEAAATCRERLLDVSVKAPLWEDVARGAQPVATQKVEDRFLSGAMWPRMFDSSRALLRSQGGHMAGLPFTCVPLSSLAAPLAPFALFCSPGFITVQPAQWQVFWGEGVLQLRARQLVCVVKLGPESP